MTEQQIEALEHVKQYLAGYKALRHNAQHANIEDLHILVDSIEAMRKDAERYRWLRDRDNFGPLQVGQPIGVHDEYPRFEEVNWLIEDEIDRALDALMAAPEVQP